MSPSSTLFLQVVVEYNSRAHPSPFGEYYCCKIYYTIPTFKRDSVVGHKFFSPKGEGWAQDEKIDN